MEPMEPTHLLSFIPHLLNLQLEVTFSCRQPQEYDLYSLSPFGCEWICCVQNLTPQKQWQKKKRFNGQRNRETVNLFLYINPHILAILLKIIPSVLSIINILEIILRRILTVAANCKKLFEKSDIQCFISNPRLLERKGKKKKKWLKNIGFFLDVFM